MAHGVVRIASALQLLLQGREGVLPKALVNPPVLLQILIADGGHVLLFIRKMLDRVGLQILNALLTGALVFLLLLVKSEELVDYLKEPLMLFINYFNAHIVLILPGHHPSVHPVPTSLRNGKSLWPQTPAST